ncbi:MAG: two-component system response regulator [Candidatus Omnitrophica bacterium CG07_land_8_20_14_0_80_42_15]|uniref:Two-component system response regulator n=1 Tax=Candidatus Aquitaenariimonas noxiae TaxID=1974741 RepID=A0A2J0L1A9_9BACT|nr:MAG: two-component system response regulator [Candidatus Omnitrophica bacterium CG07_land_8_20_14_0_80_42_15]
MNKGKILVVDDEMGLVELIKGQLEYAGYGVVVAYNGPDALQKAASETPALVILDIKMPVMDGLEVLRKLRNIPEAYNIPIIMFTQVGETRGIFEAQDLMATDYIIKPFSLKKLIGMVDKHMKAGRLIDTE